MRAQFNFTWLFAIIAGAAFLFLAIYGVNRLVNQESYQSNTEIARKLEVITDPLQAGFASSSYGRIDFQRETKIEQECSDMGYGENRLSVATRTGIGEKWQEPSAWISTNKYIFLSGAGEEWYVFS
ncbi:MAG: hypothetical protein ACP5D2_03635, partial [Candidatus Nanoarchaeia archaeon]